MGALVASAVGLIVVTGLTKMFIHINSQISYLEKKTQQINLIGIIGEAMRNPSYCTETIKPVESDLRSGTTQELYQIRAPNGSGGGSRAIMELDDDFKANYGMKGIARFEVSCDEGDCTCSSPSSSSPCTKKWSFNLISQSQNNNVPIFNRIMKTPITITFTGSDPDDVSCCQTGESLQNGACVSQPIAVSQPNCSFGLVWDGSKCDCPPPSIRVVSTSGGQHRVACTCPHDSRAYWDGSRCLCYPSYWYTHFDGTRCIRR